MKCEKCKNGDRAFWVMDKKLLCSCCAHKGGSAGEVITQSGYHYMTKNIVRTSIDIKNIIYILEEIND